MAVKTDMSKAYDRLEWSFLRDVMVRFGFHPTWVHWIMECVSSVSYSYLINGGAHGCVVPSRGIRQGDPLSPYLFILCSEVLSGLCSKALEQGKLCGIKVARNSPPLNHLLFADDTMFFCKSDPISCKELKNILEKYEVASGQSINCLKSAITFSAKTPIETRRRVKAELNIVGEGGIGKYLGLPEHFNRKKRDIFASIIDRIRQKSHSWTSRYLNGAGKLVLLKSILSAMPTYAMTCFKLPKSFCKQIQTVLTRFWWDDKPDHRKMSWVAWSTLTLPKRAGGLGCREIEKFNDALLAKLAWRILKFPESLLAQTLAGKYCHSTPFLSTPAPKSASHGWRGVIAGREVLRQGLGWVIGNGSDINAWSDPWLSPKTPMCPMGPPTEQNKELKVSDLLNGITKEWDLPAIRLHLPQYEEHILKLVPSEFHMKDELRWLHTRSGEYSTKTGYTYWKTNRGEELTDFNWNLCIWQIRTSPKLKHFLWKIKSKALPVGANLLHRGIQVEGRCKRCGLIETERHVFLQCPFARRVWDLVPVMFKPDPSIITSPEALLQTSRRIVNLPPLGLGETDLYPWIFWYLWIGRNRLIFENREGSEQELARQVSNLDVEAQCFVDAAWNAGTSGGGFGCIFKDMSNKTFHRSSSNRSIVGSALIAEALAVKADLKAARSLGLRKLVI
ncbi:uncharacterized protein LOC130506757 [Raphanus sativus]|uniref:Uncharacterized protein LOC130500186 n=1 Tax=Raphanus sativus TaxID=3726 RepID=A0A9W3CH56_RAPSA|nr:uncharacterized protein LOC130500186 [Raphanus sativus]XP_056857421.1 uncharacterized protein LOC130506757 [Raphanus sativus]